MIVAGLMLVSLLVLALAGRGLGDPEDESSGGLAGALLFLLLLVGIVLKKQRDRAEDEDC